MSRRRKRRGARDGYINLPARLGGASTLLSAGTYERTFPFNPALLTSLYRESWIAKRIIDMPGEDMTRGWYTLPLEEKQMEELRALESRHDIRREITDGIRWARLYGGAVALMVIDGHEGFLSEPLDPDTVMPGSFCGLLVRDRLSVTPSAELEDDLNDPDFGYPMYYDLQADAGAPGGMPGTLRVHHSRVLRFTGRDLPRAEEAAEQYWGASELEHIWEELQKRSATSANIAQLVNVLQSPILTEGPRMVKTPTYYAFKLFSHHQENELLESALMGGTVEARKLM
jgi:phage-related protein (TIGR01555 family)